MFDPEKHYSCSTYNTPNFIYIETTSGRGMVAADPMFPGISLPQDVDVEILGSHVIKELSSSRTLSLEECGVFFDLDKENLNYEKWVQELIGKYGYESRRELFKDMKHCSVMCSKGLITISPSRHEKLEAWGGTGIKDADHVIIPADSTPTEIGAALRLAFSRCIG